MKNVQFSLYIVLASTFFTLMHAAEPKVTLTPTTNLQTLTIDNQTIAQTIPSDSWLAQIIGELSPNEIAKLWKTALGNFASFENKMMSKYNKLHPKNYTLQDTMLASGLFASTAVVLLCWHYFCQSQKKHTSQEPESSQEPELTE
jgi:hypothetical protein